MGFYGRESETYAHATPAEAALELRGERVGWLDIDRAAVQLGVEVRRRVMDLRLHGLTLSAEAVTINSDLGLVEQRFALAHELGHVLIRRNALAPAATDREEERLADRFACDLLLPRDCAARRTTNVRSTAEEFGVAIEVVLTQVAGTPGIPPVVRSARGAICCRTCGFVARRPSCECSPFRRDARLACRLAAVA